ncbi:MAG: 4Fe-4S dicluster domain-containing protein, partial [Microthrixaceae bacterium]
MSNPTPTLHTTTANDPVTGDPRRVGFFTDTSVCIGCKACEVACKQWNQLPDDGFSLTAKSFDNTIDLDATTWRHVGFIERDEPVSGQETNLGDPFSWLFIPDSCKHCTDAGCLDNCPTGALVRTEYDTVYVQPDICNGCGTCVVSCPFGVIDRHPTDGRAWKCTMCYDRLR